MAANLQTLARELNVSISTVSRAFRHDSALKPSTRAQILELAARRGYMPSETRRRGRRGAGVKATAARIAVVIPAHAAAGGDAVHWPHAGVLAGMANAAAAMGMELSVIAYDAHAATTQPDVPSPAGVAGMALMCRFPPEQVARLASRMPVASLVFDYPDVERVDCVGADDIQAMGKLAERLVSLGHRRIGFIGIGGCDSSWARDRFLGYVGALHQHEMALDRRLVLNWDHGDRLTASEDRALRQAMGRGATAWMCGNDLQAMALHQHLLGQGRSAPRDVSITGFDGVEAQPGLPRVTSAQPPAEAIGCTLLRCLRSRLERPTQSGRRVLFRCRIIDGQTVGPAPAAKQDRRNRER